MAAPKPAIPPRALLATPSHAPPKPDCAKWLQLPEANRKALIPTHSTRPTLASVRTRAIRPPDATDAQLINATAQMAASAADFNPLRFKCTLDKPITTC